ncbi:MAG: zinc ribbon domain-containing protein [Christensenellales bacterium]
MFCTKCGKTVDDTSDFCVHCGGKTDNAQPRHEAKKRNKGLAVKLIAGAAARLRASGTARNMAMATR